MQLTFEDLETLYQFLNLPQAHLKYYLLRSLSNIKLILLYTKHV